MDDKEIKDNLTEVQELGDITVASAPEPEVMTSAFKEAILPVTETKSGLLNLTARQWAIGAGISPSRSGGFVYWAGKKFGTTHKMTSAQWPAVWDEFSNRPVK